MGSSKKIDCAEFQRLVESGTTKEWDKHQGGIEVHSAECDSCSFLLTQLAEKAEKEFQSD